jgi:hypothetical protein
VQGGRYVIPIAWCTLEMSRFAGIHVTVTSPHVPRGDGGGSTMRCIERPSPSTYFGRACTRSGRKCFHERIFLAADGMARIVASQSRGSRRNVASWQWSGLSWDISTRSGSRSRSLRLEMDGFVLCSECEKMEFRMIDGPESQAVHMIRQYTSTSCRLMQRRKLDLQRRTVNQNRKGAWEQPWRR